MNQYYTLWHCWEAIDFWLFTEIDLCDYSRALLFYLLKNSHIRFTYVIHVHFYTSKSKPGLATPKNKRSLVQKSLQRPFFVSYSQHQPSILYSFLKLDVLDRGANFRGSIKPEKRKKLEPAYVILSGTEVVWDKLWLSKVFSYYVGPHVLGKRAWRAQFSYRDTLIVRDRLSWWIFAVKKPLNILEH